MEMVEEMHKMGHVIGLHFHLNGLKEIDKVVEEIKKEIEIINAYQDEFFSYVEDMTTSEPKIKYLSDARHRWNYGLVPNEEVLYGNEKVQILTHPYTWTSEGYDNLNNFRTLYTEKCEEIINTFDSECKHFKEIKDEL